MSERARSLPVVSAAGAIFCVALIFLALQMRAGDDPAIGAGADGVAQASPRPVIVRRVIVRRIVEEAPSAPAGAAPSAAAPAATAPAAPTAPAPAAPAAPAPAAPAPVTTQAS